MSNTQDLSLNINVNKAQIMLNTVSSSSGVDYYLLLEDDGFCNLLTKLAHSVSINEGVEALTEYVNNNY